MTRFNRGHAGPVVDRMIGPHPRCAAAGVSKDPSSGLALRRGLRRLRGWEMPRLRMRVCAEPGCPELGLSPRCTGHSREREQARGSRQQRGYDATYDRARRRWAPKVAACTVHCHAPTCLAPSGRLILPGQAWDLGHDEQRNIRGPEHSVCNRSAGGKAAHG